MRLHGTFMTGLYENYVVLFEEGKLATPICILTEYEYQSLIDEIAGQKKSLKSSKE